MLTRWILCSVWQLQFCTHGVCTAWVEGLNSEIKHQDLLIVWHLLSYFVKDHLGLGYLMWRDIPNDRGDTEVFLEDMKAFIFHMDKFCLVPLSSYLQWLLYPQLSYSMVMNNFWFAIILEFFLSCTFLIL